MPRTVVPPVRVDAGGPGGAIRLEGGDDLPTKLVKYVPAETIAFFVPATAGIGSGRGALLLVVVVAGVIGTVAWLWYKGSSQPEAQRPRAHFYVLSAIAFLVWAVATAPNVAALARLDSVTAGVLLLLAVFLIPLADGVLTKLRG